MIKVQSKKTLYLVGKSWQIKAYFNQLVRTSSPHVKLSQVLDPNRTEQQQRLQQKK